MTLLSFFSLIDIDGIIENSLILFLLVAIYSSFSIKDYLSNPLRKVFFGLGLSGVVMLLMSFPLQFEEGLIFDTRTVLLSLSGLFFGFIPTLIAVVVSSIHRITIGGFGTVIGVSTIFVSSGIGLLFRKYRNRLKNMSLYLEYLIFAYVVGIAVFSLFYIFEFQYFSDKFLFLSFTFLGIYPVLTYFLCLFIKNQEDRDELHRIINYQKRLLQASIDSPKVMEIFVLDKDFRYLTLNSYHKHCMKKYYNVEVHEGDSFLEHIRDSAMYNRYQSQISKAMRGIAYTSVDEVETTPGKYYESMFTPIIEADDSVIGVGIFAYDVSKRKEYEEHILYLNHHDPLTSLFNRRYYSEEIIKYSSPEHFPLSIIMADINGLKIVNDAFGHNEGDQLLKIGAKVLDEVFSQYGFVARIGGDEFIAVLKNTSQEDAKKMIERVDDLLKEEIVSGVKVSISMGVETLYDDTPIHKIVTAAEDNMYKNKLYEKNSNKNEAISAIMKTLHEKNKREELHSKRVSKYCELIGKLLGLSKDRIKLLSISGTLHDIGKIAINESILNKPGRLTTFEWVEIKKHPEIGYRILSASTQYADIAIDILHHHERYDGLGYPQGISGEDIPYHSRIIAIADAFDAMTSTRPYREALSNERAIQEIEDNLGKQFDPDIGTVFVNHLKAKNKDIT